jgi:hypothetical protein
MNIQPAYVSYEQAKLLKEKGFDVLCRNRLTSLIDSSGKYETPQNFNKYLNAVSLPEQWQVVEWLLKTHNIFLWAQPYADRATFQPYWVYMNEKSKKAPLQYHLSGNASICGSDYKSPQEAYSASFDYILKELI